MRLTLANIITLLRLLLLVPALYFLLNDQRWLALSFLGAVLLGDMLDGALARLRNEVSALGKVLDPAVDKIVFASVMATLVVLGDLHWITLAAFVLLQIIVVVGAILWFKEEKSPPSARPLGKIASFLLSAGLLMAILHPVFHIFYYNWVVYGGMILMYAAGFDYLINLIHVLKGTSQEKSLRSKPKIRAEEGR
ncbi:CDP-alcohol phosphatidyltransferase family protein [Candidatus Acetothermia bacterium]|nr:CDP-alcohol phosphatidyltransferase family protein [Candidatus Acetothermia bacterium]MBI3643544.1 CDP-alcohol phosphatidyltransferase family protein [Candidatus Acetothermia bacterium]